MTPAAATRPGLGPREAARAAEDVKRGWRAGAPCDAAAVVRSDPSLAEHRSVVIDLAYEEFCLREAAGSTPDPAAFAARFPAHRSSLVKVLEGHLCLVRHPGLLAPLAWPAPGDRCEGLDVVRELGRGTFGRAYLAHDPATDRSCVLKLSAGGTAEARVIAKLRHPHVTDVYWARPVGAGVTGVCMPLVGVTTLEHVRDALFPPHGGAYPADAGAILGAIDPGGLAGVPPSGPPVVTPGRPYPAGVAAVGAGIAAALGCAHSAGVTHGDVKPSNVVLGPGGHPFLIDFNLSAAGADAAPRVGGTLPYMAPEILAAVAGSGTPPGAWGPAADLYSLGATLFCLLTGRVPYLPDDAPTGPAVADLLARVRAGGADVRSLAPRVPAELAAVVERCLAPSPGDRPAGAEEVRARLEAAAGFGPRPFVRRRAAKAVAAAALVSVAAATGVAVYPPAPTAGAAAPRVVAGGTVDGRPDPTDPDAFLSRGVEHLRADRLAAAQDDFSRAIRGANDPRAAAFISYCLARRSQFADAFATGRIAARSGPPKAALLNNLGYCLWRLRRPAEALEAVDEALRLDPSLPAAVYNRAMARYTAGLGPDFRLADRRAADDLATVLAGRPGNAALNFEAARVFAALSAGGPESRDRAVRCLTEAAELGMDPAGFARDPVLAANLGGERDFQLLCGTPRPAVRARSTPYHTVCLVWPE